MSGFVAMTSTITFAVALFEVIVAFPSAPHQPAVVSFVSSVSPAQKSVFFPSVELLLDCSLHLQRVRKKNPSHFELFVI